MADVAVLVRAARRSRRLTQAQLGHRVGLDQSHVSRCESPEDNPTLDTIERLLAGSGHRLYAAPTRRDDVATIAAQIKTSLESSDTRLALRLLIQLNDNLVAETGLVRGVLAITEPELTGNKTWDAAIAALVQWRLGEEELPTPEWAAQPERRLERARVLRFDPADPIPTSTDVPAEFLDHGVLVWADTFASV